LPTNNPSEVEALTRAGIGVDETVALQTSPHIRNAAYLRAKEARLGHVARAGAPLGRNGIGEATNVAPLLAGSAAPDWRPYVVLDVSRGEARRPPRRRDCADRHGDRNRRRRRPRVARVGMSVRLTNRSVHVAGEDLFVAADVE
jgi:hypothetical protein